MAYALVALLLFAVYHAVHHILATIPVAVNQRDSPIAGGYLPWRVASETDVINPLDAGQLGGYLISDEPHVHCLVEVDAVAALGNLVELCKSPIGSKHVVVEQYCLPPLAILTHLVDVPVWRHASLLDGHHAPLAAVRASSGKKSDCRVCRPLRVDAVVRRHCVHIGLQLAGDVVACASFDHLVGIDDVVVVLRKVENLCHIADVVMVEGKVVFHLIALSLVPCAELHQCKVGHLPVDCVNCYFHPSLSVLLSKSIVYTISCSFCQKSNSRICSQLFHPAAHLWVRCFWATRYICCRLPRPCQP